MFTLPHATASVSGTCTGTSCLGEECKYVPRKLECALQDCPRCHQPFPEAVPLDERRAFSTTQRNQGKTASSTTSSQSPQSSTTYSQSSQSPTTSSADW